jgi:antitoxin HicB
MAGLAYPARFERDDNGTIQVSFRDVPEAHSFGEDEADARARAVDALETALSLYVGRREGLPRPSAAKRGERLVPLSALGAAKVALWETMRAQRIGKAELARRLGVHMPQVDRILDLCHASKMEQVESALGALGKRLVVTVADAA